MKEVKKGRHVSKRGGKGRKNFFNLLAFLKTKNMGLFLMRRLIYDVLLLRWDGLSLCGTSKQGRSQEGLSTPPPKVLNRSASTAQIF